MNKYINITRCVHLVFYHLTHLTISLVLLYHTIYNQISPLSLPVCPFNLAYITLWPHSRCLTYDHFIKMISLMTFTSPA